MRRAPRVSPLSADNVEPLIVKPRPVSWCLIIVSHRMSMLSDADKIIVIKDGLIDGGPLPHDLLIASCNTYKKMWEQQNIT